MGTGEDARWLARVAAQFASIAGDDGEISLQEFKAALGVKESFFAERFFALFDSDGSGTISLEELLRALSLLVHGSEMDKLRFLFQVYDVDGSGSIEPDELRTVLRSCLGESAVSLPEERLDALTLALFEAADKDRSGSITFQELREELERFPEVTENLTISAASWLKPPSPRERSRRPRCPDPAGWHRRRGELGCLGGYAALNLLLFAPAALGHVGRGAWLPLARGCGQCLNFNCAFIAVLVLRRCLTRLRATRLAKVLPLDQSVVFHRRVGYVVAALAALHTAAHVANFGRLARDERRHALWEYLLTARPGVGGASSTAALTGLVLQLLLATMLAFSGSCVRRSGHFEVFYWSHLCYVCVWALLLLHGPNFWKWFAVPGCLFVLEKVAGLAAWRAGGLRIVEVNLLPSEVTHLVIKRPPSFRYEPGDYVYLNVPAIAAYEWHPFSISSAPEQPDTIWLHVRSRGQWTSRLHEYFQQPEPLSCRAGALAGNPRGQRGAQDGVPSATGSEGSAAAGADSSVELTVHGAAGEEAPPAAGVCAATSSRRLCDVKCYVDGPYGTPTRRIFSSEHAVLIGAGIGITPFASILQSVMYRYRMRKQSCPRCGHSWCQGPKDEAMALRKVDFIWINRDQKHFEWFVSLLAKLEMEQAEQEPGGRFLEMHMYMTSALGKSDVKAIGLQTALDLLAAKEQKDSITGLRTRTRAGRPDWGQVFRKVAEEKKGKVQVFFCGSPALAKVVKAHCERFNFRFFKESF